MNRTTSIKQALLQVTFVTTILLMAIYGYSQNLKDTTDAVQENSEATSDNSKQGKDAQFLVRAAEINLEQIQLGKLAQQKGETTDVQELGKMMEDAHTKSQRELTALAKSKMITIPNSPTDNAQDAYKKFNEKSGNGFDKDYADMLVSGHKDAVEAFEEASTDCKDTEIKNWATASLTGLRTQLDHSLASQKKVNTMYLEKNK